MRHSLFIQRRARLLASIAEWLEIMNAARSVTWSELVPGEIDNERPNYADIERGEAMIFRETFPGRRASIEDEEIDPDRTIQIALGRTTDWKIIATISSSINEVPVQLIDPSDEALREAIKSEHDHIFQDWPLTDAQFERKGEEILRRRREI